MKILINNYAAEKGGALTVLEGLMEYIDENTNGHEWIFLLNTTTKKYNNIQILTMRKSRLRWIQRLLFDFIVGRRIVNKVNPDVYVSMQNTFTYGVKAKQFVYIHQAIPFYKDVKYSFFKKDERKLYLIQNVMGKIIFKSVFNAESIIVQSNTMKEKIVSLNLKKSELINVVNPNCIIAKFEDTIKPINRNCFIVVTSNHKYKNNNIIYEAVKKLNIEKISDFTIYMTIKKDENINNDNIVFLGNVSRNVLFDYYKNCIVIMTSLVESYPMILKEACSIGSHIIAVDRDYTREILAEYDNHVLYDKDNVQSLVDSIKNAINANIFNVNKVFDNQITTNNWGQFCKVITSE
ncbi:MAG: hypothetical protein A2Y45_00490 [Tenericutes bacterium GWC2_34_14]|nr:MAG: hypothetical protein A2Y45_00490 [Tenericutes bacterium GWC2_34_14]OHE34478.1 MAG: hypothetical protein A2012_08110 [Tenericutes bacterium GWE2_34_108]OHE35834.1 MAG: hypothetical protein A2Y46_02815 [Tenericutes bacterium GWF1_35_14]OHE39079.1 MAG: hypothetical protein A2Y44_07115 [Tenericutes bacterium GWF2_35_184]OHE42854.1 MAG: hypothetical protein A2221_09120 [Tenericutes bacterium RIFOXYA2_FULL_36_32]OHE46082.1 MAG: hypothetical protein A2308_00790 [Tenericutes bacterium RIFOXYB2